MIKPKHKTNFRILLISVLAIAGLSYYSCRKDSKDTGQPVTDQSVLQAKGWYENTYPINNNNAVVITGQHTATTGNNLSLNGTFDLSQLIRPDWNNAVKYVRFNTNVIEMPVAPGYNAGFDLKNATANKLYSNKRYNRASFLVLYDGKSYHAYVMIIMADSAYVNGDLSKLSDNTYRKHDADFTGMVLYFTPKGEYNSGYAYKNGVLITPSTTQAVSSSSLSLKVTGSAALQGSGIFTPKTDVAAPPVSVCTDWYLDTYIDGVLTSSEYIGTTCDSAGSSDGGSGSSTSDEGGDTPPPPPICPSSGGGSTDAVVLRQTTDMTAPPGSGGTPTEPPSDPGYPAPTEECSAVNQSITTDSLLTYATLTQLQKDTLQSILNTILQNCLGQALDNYFIQSGTSFSVASNPNALAPAGYNPSTNLITINFSLGLTPAALQEEIFHAYQNSTMSGGTGQYAGEPGSANIEFEAKVLKDITWNMEMYNGNGTGGAWTINDPNYQKWISSITNNFTEYPTSFTATQLTQYFTFIPEFLQQNPGYSNDIENPSLSPTAMFSLIQISSCSH